MDRDSKKASRVGLYTTISFHLIVLIILLVVSITEITKSEGSFVLDFSKAEEKEALQREETLKQQVSEELDQLLATNRSHIRNIAVDASGETLKDDRNSNPSDVYQQARELQDRLNASKREAMSQEQSEDVVDISQPSTVKNTEPAKTYKGPSVISYTLDGRKAQSLPVPAYMGYGAGDVTVEIIVNQSGRVLSATVITAISSTDISLQEFAIDAAKRSRFTASKSAPAKEVGQIVYRFIAQ